MKGEAIRFLRSNTDAHTYYNTLRTFSKDFVDRTLNNIMHDLRASYIPSLTPSPSPSPSPSPLLTILRLVTTYSPHYTSLVHLLHKHWSLIRNDPSLSTIFPSLPQLSFRRNPTLADSLVRAYVSGSRRPPTGPYQYQG